MKKFLAIFTCAENSKNHEAWKKLIPADQEANLEKGKLAQQEWATKYKNKIIYDGGHLADQTKIVDAQGIRDVPSQMGHFIVIEARSHDEAANIFLKHPHFTFFPGDGVEIVECHTGPRVEI